MTRDTNRILDVHHLNVTFKRNDLVIPVVKDVAFSINRGEAVALVGESGSGKTLTALSILKLLPPAASVHGQVQFYGKNLIAASEHDMESIRGDRVSMIFQEPMTALNPLHTIEHQIAEVVYLHKTLSRTTVRARVEELIDLVGLRDVDRILASYPHQLSGGQRQRVIIAMALANEPDLLIADEPTTALDVTIQAQILKLLKKLQKEFSMSLLLITHDLSIVRRMADRVCVMSKGEIVEQGEVQTLFDAPQHPYTLKLINSSPKGPPVAVDTQPQPPLISTEHLRVWFPIKKGVFKTTVGHVKAVDDVTFSIKPGHTLGIVGESGSGKSTLGFALLRLERSTGIIQFQDQRIDLLGWKEMRSLRSDLQIVFQDPFSALSPRQTIEQIIAEGLDVHGLYSNPQERMQKIDEAILEVGLDTEMKNRYPHEFSGGQRQRIAIARALILKPKFLVLDEPTSALDMTVQSQIVDLLRSLQEKYKLTYLFISHDLRVINAISHDVLVMKNGQVIESGSRDDVFKTPKTDYTKALISAAYDVNTIS